MAELAQDRTAIVSSESDSLILVNDQDEQIGSADKASCHDGEGLLHRAFSVLLFNSEGDLLLQKRAAGKRLWGGFWSNSCCSHPRLGESMEEASQRRVWEELGLRAELTYLYKFQYHANFGDLGSERELCWVFAGVCSDEPSVNANEISEWRYISAAELDEQLIQNRDDFTPWFKMEWERINQQYANVIDSLLSD